jgi:DNA repair exonuclease SbcCD nuclease subunit
MATRGALANLVDTAIDEEVGLVLLAGDIFDGDWPHYGTGVHFVKEMGRLREAGIWVVAISGNHDAESRLTKSLRLPDNVRMLSTRRPETVLFEDLGIAVHGQGYAMPAVYENLAATYPAPLPGLINIGLLHTSADGRPGHERYAPCSVEGLREHGYDYWALGHIHQREVLSQNPPIVFAGNLQGRGLRETGPKGATLMAFRDDGSVVHEPRVLDRVRWEHLKVDAQGCAHRDDVVDRAVAELRPRVRAVDDRLLAVRVSVCGRTAAHRELAGGSERLRYEIIAAAGDVAGDQVWVEDVQLRTCAPQALAAAGDDAVGELIGELKDAMDDEHALGELAESLRPLADALPDVVLDLFDPLDSQTMHELMADVERSLPAVLLQRTTV